MQPSQPHPILWFLAVIAGLLLVAATQVGLHLLIGDLRKSTPKERRWASAFIAFLPIFLLLFAYLGYSYLDRAGLLGIWLYMMGCALVGFIWLWVWTRFVSVKVTWCVGAFVWVITLWLSFTN